MDSLETPRALNLSTSNY